MDDDTLQNLELIYEQYAGKDEEKSENESESEDDEQEQDINKTEESEITGQEGNYSTKTSQNAAPISINKSGKFFKRLYSFLESNSLYISMLLKCKVEKEAKSYYAKSKYSRLYAKRENTEKTPTVILEELKNICKEKFTKYSDERIKEYIREIAKDPPKENCSLHKILFKKNEKDIYVNHNIISYMLDYFDSKTLMTLKECSKLDSEIVSLYLRKLLYALPFKEGEEEFKTNICYWSKVINHFFRRCGRLTPVERINNPLIINALKHMPFCCCNKNDFTNLNIYVSLDYLNEQLITYADDKKPQAHTSNPQNEWQGEKNLKTQEITIIEFIEEYYKRLVIDEDELIWNVCGFRKSKVFLSLLFLEYLKCLDHIVKKYHGKRLFKKTEYFVNTGLDIRHRIWIQAFYEYTSEHGTKQKKDNENFEEKQTLYLTIADHFLWNS